MLYPSWQSSKDKLRHYSRREPEFSSLYRLVYHYREQLEYCWDDCFAATYGQLRQEVLESFDRYLNCGILRHGCVLACCENRDCNHSMLVAFSCKRRGVCPSCQAKRAVLFADNLEQNVLLNHPHRHLVFSIPKRLRIYFKYNRRLFSLLYRAAWDSWSEWVDAVAPGARPGVVMALHTAGSLLTWHPHIRSIVLDGGILPGGSFVQLPEVDTELVQEFFTEKVFSFLLAEDFLEQETVDLMKSWQHSGFNLYSGEPIGGDDENARLFLARYLKKAPLSLERLSIDESSSEPTVRYVKQLGDSEPGVNSEREFSPLEFLAELSSHVPRVFEQTTRFYGEYSPRSRGAKGREERYQKLIQNNIEPLEEPIPTRTASQSWARCMKLVFEIDTLVYSLGAPRRNFKQ